LLDSCFCDRLTKLSFSELPSPQALIPRELPVYHCFKLIAAFISRFSGLKLNKVGFFWKEKGLYNSNGLELTVQGLIGMNNPDGLEDAEFYLANAAEDDALEAELEDL
jgi:hypothetical protein